MNIFSLESVLDELALVAQVDPLDFRLAHMKDERARAVMQEAASDWVGHTAHEAMDGEAVAWRSRATRIWARIARLRWRSK
jgi:nicotinate dehydrogenase subunit B